MKMQHTLPGLLSFLMLLPVLASADPVTINNFSFESPGNAPNGFGGVITDWQDGDHGGTQAGTFHPTTSRYPGGLPNGDNIAFSNGPVIFQVLGEPLTEGSTYTLNVDVGDRNDTGFPGYTVQLRAGGTVLSSTSAPTPANGTFATATVNYTATAGDPQLGMPLEVRLLSNGGQINYDNVNLDASVLSTRTPISIVNPGFEADVLGDGGFISSITGWSDAGDQGTFNPGAGSGLPSEGENVAFSNGGTIAQVLVDTLQANTNYELTADIVDRFDLTSPGYSIQLLAGGVLLAEDNSGTLPGTNGDFLTSLVSFDVGDTHSELGQQLEIRLISNGTQTNFDNIRLSSLSTAVIPEPASIAIWTLIGLGLGSFGYYRSRKKK